MSPAGLLVALSRLTLNTPVALPMPTDRPLPTKPRPSSRVTRRMRGRIVELYEQGLSSRVVCVEVGVARSTVLRVLKEEGVKRRPPHLH